MPRFSPEEIDQIRRHRLDTTAYILVDETNCFGIRPGDFAKVKGRRLVPIGDDALPTHPLPDSWVLAVLLCPGRDLARLSRWAAKLPAPTLHRIWFYEMVSAPAREAFGPWKDLKLPFPRRERVDDAREFNDIFANELNIRILLDHPVPEPRDKT